MDAHPFAALVRSLARPWPRRRLVATAGAGAIAAVTQPRRAVNAQAAVGSVHLPCQPCNGAAAGGGACCLIGITGGGVVRTDHGEITLILFATRIGPASGQDAAGFVRWIDPHVSGGVTLESTGPVAYITDTGDARTREIRGLMTRGGADAGPFILRLVDAGPEAIGQDTVALTVGARLADQTAVAAAFGYAAQGPLVGGDLQLLGAVAPVTPPQ